MKTYLPTTQTATIESYPYGWKLKTTAHYSVEYKSGKGFRTIFQTVNPKTGKLNKPKASVYHPVVVLVDDNGVIKSHTLEFYDDKGKTEDLAFMFEHFNLFTDEQIKGIAIYCLTSMKADIYAKATYCGSPTDKLLPLYEPAIKALLTIAKTGENLFDLVKVDWEAVKSLEVPGFNPFTHRTL